MAYCNEPISWQKSPTNPYGAITSLAQNLPAKLNVQLWGTASTSNTEILERFQSKESLAHDSGRTLVRAEYGYQKGSPNTNS
jgi:hypothetical protein